jgi:hypothetical protein
MFPTPHTVGVMRYLTGAEDEYGNDVESWADPEPVRVHGWGPAGTEEDNEGRTRVVADLQLMAPAGFTVDPQDRVEVDGVVYEVEGKVEDYTHGPFGFAGAGVRVNLNRVTG